LPGANLPGLIFVAAMLVMLFVGRLSARTSTTAKTETPAPAPNLTTNPAPPVVAINPARPTLYLKEEKP
jgi:hypothetical protein